MLERCCAQRVLYTSSLMSRQTRSFFTSHYSSHQLSSPRSFIPSITSLRQPSRVYTRRRADPMNRVARQDFGEASGTNKEYCLERRRWSEGRGHAWASESMRRRGGAVLEKWLLSSYSAPRIFRVLLRSRLSAVPVSPSRKIFSLPYASK